MNYNDPEKVPPIWQVGDVILDRYEVKQIFTGGGMGLVYRVYHRDWDIDLAVKSPRTEFSQTQNQIENFEREAETWVNLGLHPHTVSCYYVRRLGGIPRLFAEFIEGGSLADWIRSGKLYQGGPQRAAERILDIAIQFAWGLHFAHEKTLIHQDVKPANVLMALDGTAKVSDFGLAKTRKLAGESAASHNGGQSILVSSGAMTPAYCSPEQARGETLSKKTDIWSWAVSVLEMFTGEVVWLSGSAAASALDALLEADATRTGLPIIPPELGSLLETCFLEQARRPFDLSLLATQLKTLYDKITDVPYSRSRPEAHSDVAADCSNRALASVELGHPEQAESCWKKALGLDLWHLPTWYNWLLFRLRHRIADLSSQRQDRDKLIKNVSDTCGAWLAVARLFLDQKQPEAALWLLQQAEKDARETREKDSGVQSDSFEQMRRLTGEIKRSFPVAPISQKMLSEGRAKQLAEAYSKLEPPNEDPQLYQQVSHFAAKFSREDSALEKFAQESALSNFKLSYYGAGFSVFRLRGNLALINIRESHSFWIFSLSDLELLHRFATAENTHTSAVAVDRNLTLLGIVSNDCLTIYSLPYGVLKRTAYLPFRLGWKNYVALRRIGPETLRFLAYNPSDKTLASCRYSLALPELNIPVGYEICKPASHKEREVVAGCIKHLRQAVGLLARTSADNLASFDSVNRARHLIEQVKLQGVSQLEWHLRYSWESLYPHYKKRSLRGAARGRRLHSWSCGIVASASHDGVLFSEHSTWVWHDNRCRKKTSLGSRLFPNGAESDDTGGVRACLGLFSDIVALAVAHEQPNIKKMVITVRIILIPDGSELETLVLDFPGADRCSYPLSFCIAWSRSERFLWVVTEASLILLSFEGGGNRIRKVIPIEIAGSAKYDADLDVQTGIVGAVPGASDELLWMLIATLKDGITWWQVEEIDAFTEVRRILFYGAGTPAGIFVSPDYTVLVVVTGKWDDEGETMFFSLAEEKLLFVAESGKVSRTPSVDWLEESRFSLVSTDELFVIDLRQKTRCFPFDEHSSEGQACFTNAGRSVILLTSDGPTMWHLDWELEDQTIYSTDAEIPEAVLARWCDAGLTPVRNGEIAALAGYLSHHGFGAWSEADLGIRVKEFIDRYSASSLNRRPLIEQYDAKRRLKSITEEHKRKKDELTEQLTHALSNILLGEKISVDVVNAETGEFIIPANRKITKTLLRKLALAHDRIEIDPSPTRDKIREIIQAYEHKFAQLAVELERQRSVSRAAITDDTDPGIMGISPTARPPTRASRAHA